jgi:hypothetical protein
MEDNLKVVNMNGGTETMEGPQGIANAKAFNEFDEKAMKLEEEMVEMQDKLAKKKYRVKTTEETFDFMMNDFYSTVSWAGYECYAISETHKEFEKIQEKLKPSSNGKVSFSVKPEILEAVFHFMKQYTASGLEVAKKHRLLCEDFSVAMATLNEDRKALMELATEAEAAKHGITVEDYKKAAQQINKNNG